MSLITKNIHMSKKKKPIQYESFNIEDSINIETFQESVILFFKDVPDPRAPDNCDYLLSDLLIIIDFFQNSL